MCVCGSCCMAVGWRLVILVPFLLLRKKKNMTKTTYKKKAFSFRLTVSEA